MKKIKLTVLVTSIALTAFSQNTNKIESTGNVGIGTTTPSRPLDVSGVQGWESSGTEKAYLNPSSTGVDMALYGSTSFAIRFDARSGANSYFNSGGNLGIGITNPNEKLSIGGRVRSSGTDEDNLRFIVEGTGGTLAFLGDAKRTTKNRSKSIGGDADFPATSATRLDHQSTNNQGLCWP